METQIQSSEQVFCFFLTLWQIKGSKEFALLSFICCVDLEKHYYCVPSGVQREVVLEFGALGLCVNHLILGAR